MGKITLYELTDIHQSLLEMLYDDEVEQGELMDMLLELEGSIEEKADNYAKIIKTMSYDSETLKTEIERLQTRKKIVDSRMKGLKDSLEAAMRKCGKTKFKTALFSFGIQRNSQPSVIFDDETAFIKSCKGIRDDLLTYEAPKVNKTAVREAIEADGEILEGVNVVLGEHLRIR